MLRLRTAHLLGFSVLALGCGSEKQFESTPPFRNEDDVQVWATSASAVGVYAHAYEALAVADGQLGFPDPSCPVTSDDGTTLVISGGCSDDSGREWSGEATVTRDGDDLTLVLDGLNGNDGSVTRRRTGPTTHEFDAELVIGGVTTISYSGTVEGGYDGPSVWNGSGRVTRDGYVSPKGSVDASTADEVVDEACNGQPMSGSTTLYAKGDTAVITYDGATDCDEAANARFSVNGKDRGTVSGVHCAVSGVGARGASATLGFLGLALLVFRVWRRRE